MIHPMLEAKIRTDERAPKWARTHARTTRSLRPLLTRTPHLSIDEARVLPRFRPSAELVARAQMRREQGRALASAVRPGMSIARAGGDPRDLRGIPVQGVRGTSGTVRGTAPEAAVIRADTRSAEPSRRILANPARTHPNLRVTEPMVAFA